MKNKKLATMELNEAAIKRFSASFAKNPGNRIALNAIAKTGLTDVTLNREVVTGTHNSFSHVLDEWKVTNQKRSGRCWIFAGLNLLRVGMAKKMNLKQFELSQNYSFFWDQFERANYFLANILDTAKLPIDDRVVAFLLERPIEDGGQWNMFVNVVNKYGLAPKQAMPETESSSGTMMMRSIVSYKLREGALKLRTLVAKNASEKSIESARRSILDTVYRVLAIHLGEPPRTFDWQWTDKDKSFHRDGEITPLEFKEKYVDLNLDDYVCLVNDTRKANPYGKTFTVDRLGNVIGGGIVRYLNMQIGQMKKITAKIIEDGEPVWFGCDVGKMLDRKLGLWDSNLFEYDALYSTDFTLDKEQRLYYHATQMTHAMLFTGVDMVDGKPRRFRVENSWGDENDQKGFYTMNSNWFDEYMFEIAAHKRYLTPKMIAALDEKPIVLPPWDPMGALAR